MKDNFVHQFIPFEEWLYFKIFVGERISDLVLIEELKPLVSQMMDRGLVDKWFFVRFNVPDNHLRVRLHANETQNRTECLIELKSRLKPYVESNIIWNVSLDTYLREMERYGMENMSLSEDLFFHSSQAILDIITSFQSEHTRLYYAIYSCDQLLNQFGLDLEQKIILINSIWRGYSKEFGFNRLFYNRLREKYSALCEEINLHDLLPRQASILKTIYEVNQTHLALNNRVMNDLKLNENKRPFISSHLHMHLNRLFCSNPRIMEFVTFDFLHRLLKKQKNVGIQ